MYYLVTGTPSIPNDDQRRIVTLVTTDDDIIVDSNNIKVADLPLSNTTMVKLPPTLSDEQLEFVKQTVKTHRITCQTLLRIDAGNVERQAHIHRLLTESAQVLKNMRLALGL